LYLDVLDFILSSYATLSKHFNIKLDINLVNKYINLSELRFSDYTRSLDDGLLNDVVEVLRKSESSQFLEDDKKQALRSYLLKINGIRTNLAAYKSYIDEIKQEPGVIRQKPVFSTNTSLDVQLGQWSEGTEVAYAIQYRTKKAVSRISKFSKKFRLSPGMNNPTITLPQAPQTVQERFIYRQFGDANPEYVGSVRGSSVVTFMDLDLDLYDAAGLANEDFGMPQVKTLLKLGANPLTIFSRGKNAIHYAAEENNAKILRQLLNGTDGLREYDLSGPRS